MPDRPTSGNDEPYDPDATQVVRPPNDDAERTQMMQVPPAAPPPRPTGTDRPQESLPPPNLPPPSGRSGQRPPPREKRPPSTKSSAGKGRIIRRVLLAIFLIWLLILVAVPIWAWSQIDKVDASPDGDRPADQPGTTYLLVGSDSRAGLSEEEQAELNTGDGGGQRTDTIMLLHTGEGAPLLLSIPRDSTVPIPGHGTTKINAAFSFGGPELLVQTIEQSTGIYVDDYVEIGFGGFASIVDALGGVDVCADQAFTDKKAGIEQGEITKGCQEVDGETALGFARARNAFADSDLTRVQNQRQVLGAIGSDAMSPWTVLNPWRYFSVARAASSSVRIGDNVGPISLARFAWALSNVTGGDGRTCTMPITDGSATTWDPERSEQLFQLFIEDRTDDVTSTICTKTGLPASQ